MLDCYYYIKRGHNLKRYFNVLQHEQDRFMLCIKQYGLLKFITFLNGNISITMKVPIRCLLEFQGVTQQNVSRSPKYLMNQMTNFDECILI